jgi:ABC-type Fe3+/spermidine/putrescine transport system ATPase subunit
MLPVYELSKAFAGDALALHQVLVAFEPGSLTMLLGPSGLSRVGVVGAAL